MPPNSLHPGAIATFTKYQGTGNDFILIEWTSHALPPREAIRHLCDRRLGIGADGLLLLVPPELASAPRMILFNPDGTRPEMCGNGIRCAALHSLQWSPSGSAHENLVVLTDAGPRNCTVSPSGTDHAQVSVDMGIVARPKPLHLDHPPIDLFITSVGNPHAVALMPVADPDFHSLGPALSRHTAFPDGTNVEFATPTGPATLRIRVWERGAGPTLACGTGACAAVAAAIAAGLLQPQTSVVAQLPGGELEVAWDPQNGQTSLTGPAQRVFRGQIPWQWELSSPA